MNGVSQPHQDEQAIVSQQQLVELQRADGAINRVEAQLAMARERVAGLEQELVHEHEVETAMRRHLHLYQEPPQLPSPREGERKTPPSPEPPW